MLKIPLALFFGFGLVLWKAQWIKDADTGFKRIEGTIIVGSIASVISWIILSGIQDAVRIWQNQLIAFVHWIAS